MQRGSFCLIQCYELLMSDSLHSMKSSRALEFNDFGLYIHIPFCHAICHYCDFAKTANFDGKLSAAYLERLLFHIELMAPHLKMPFTSVFFGGGTPGLFSQEYRPLMDRLRSLLAPGAEVSLEANPNNCSIKSLELWRELGFNRLSIGVQTFSPVGLEFLTRDHGAAEALASIRDSMSIFTNVNIDLIYGWKGQTLESWKKDLQVALDLQIPHLSLYNLTYEPRTPIGRSFHRGGLKGADDTRLAEYYDIARQTLAENRFDHEEVSNWSKSGFSCRHNWVYWSGSHFAAIGSGAHGFLDDGSELGLRYSFGGDFRSFLRKDLPPAARSQLSETLLAMGADLDLTRDCEAAVIEYIGGALRTKRGVCLSRLSHLSHKKLQLRPAITRGITENMVLLEDNCLRLDPAEWFRENAWAVELILSLQ